LITVITWSPSIENLSDKIRKVLYKYNFLIIKNFGTDVEEFKVLNNSISKEIYLSKRMGCSLHSFRTKIYSENLSECAKSGEFHTDFAFQEDTPNYISLQCINPDPKYPLLGRNYIVSVRNVIDCLVQKFHQKEHNLLKISLPYSFDKQVTWINPFYKDKSGTMAMKVHLSLVDESLLQPEHYINNIPITRILSQIALNYSEDFVLDKGDVLIMSNKYVLHKRGESSIKIKSSLNDKSDFYSSREMNSMRFN
jgi:hypothetical protein